MTELLDLILILLIVFLVIASCGLALPIIMILAEIYESYEMMRLYKK